MDFFFTRWAYPEAMAKAGFYHQVSFGPNHVYRGTPRSYTTCFCLEMVLPVQVKLAAGFKRKTCQEEFMKWKRGQHG